MLNKPSFYSGLYLWLLGIVGAICGVLAVTVPLSLAQQLIFGAGVLVAVTILGRFRSQYVTVTICATAALVSTRYIFWRAFYTLEFHSLFEGLLGWGLFLTELYAWLILMLGFMQTAWPMTRKPVPIEGDETSWPIVDVFIPTYNEELEIVRRTVFAAQAMDYPKSRFNVFILDDGRRPKFRAFAKAAGCGYLTRKDNLHAKAGNLNAALGHTHGELIAVFDCDHVPTRGFLQMTVGWFLKDPRLALMQTPHHFYSPDPIQRNLHLGDQLPGESDLFYGTVQKGNDLWNAAFFCGSAAVIRRRALADIGNFARETVTEDAHTALRLQRNGWNTAYIDARLSAGLATERLALHVGQRIRWARGMTQILRIDNPLMGRGLNLQQRLCYLNAMLHFQFPLPRIVFLTSPLAYLLFGQNVIHASAIVIFAYALPHLFTTMSANGRLQGRNRGAFWGEIYEALIAFHLLKPTLLTLIDPKRGKFNVTAKGGTLDQSYFDITTLTPHLVVAALLTLGLVAGFTKLAFSNMFHEELSTLMLNTIWTVFSLFILTTAISVGREAKQARASIRIPLDKPATLYFDDGYVADGMIRDISFTGLSVEAPDGLVSEARKIVDIDIPGPHGAWCFPVETIASDANIVRMRFEPLNMDAERWLTSAMMGRADAWIGPDAEAAGKVKEQSSLVAGLKILGIATSVLFNLRQPRGKLRRQKSSIAAGSIGATTATAATYAAIVLLMIGSMLTAHPAHAADNLRPLDTGPLASDVDPRFSQLSHAEPDGGITVQKRYTLRDLRVNSEIRLAGAQGEIGIPFALRRDQIVTAASLTLTFAHSPSLLPDLSQLVVLINGEVVKTTALSRDNADETVVTIPVNPAILLPKNNQLNIRLIGHYTRDCEDPQNSALWANISNTRSWLDLTLQRVPSTPDLSSLPTPFFDRYSVDPLVLPFVFSGHLENGDLEAAASVSSWFGALASYRGYAFKPVFNELPVGDAIVFLVQGRPLAGLNLAINGPGLAIVPNPRSPSHFLLVIMGRTEPELKLAAAALVSGGRYGGVTASVDDVKVPVYAPYGAPRWIPTDRPVQLGELEDPLSLEGRGLPPGPLTARFRMAPDLFFWPGAGARLTTTYRYPMAAWLDHERSRLDLSLNGQFIQTLPMQTDDLISRLVDKGRSSSAVSTAHSILPDYALFGQNELSYFFDLHMADRGRCVGRLPNDVQVSIDPRSTIDLRGAYHATRLPNLALFAGAGFPFTRMPDLSDTEVIVSQNPTAPEVEAFLALMGRFGDATGAPVYRVTVTRSYQPDRDGIKHVLVIGPTSMTGVDALFEGAPVELRNGRLDLVEASLGAKAVNLLRGDHLDDPSSINESLVSSESFAGLVSFRSPDGKGTVLAVLAARPELLPGLVYSIQDRKLNSEIQGDLSILTDDGFESFKLANQYWYGNLPIWISIEYGFSQHPIVLSILVLFAAIIMGAVAHRILQSRQNKRLGAISEK